MVDLAPTAAEEDEECEPASEVEVGHGVHVVGHGPLDTLASSWREGSEAAQTELAEDHGSGDDKNGKLEDEDAESAPDGAQTAVAAPGANDHEESVETSETIGDGGESGSKGDLRALLLAVNVTLVNQLDVVGQAVDEQIFVVDVDFAAWHNANSRVGTCSVDWPRWGKIRLKLTGLLNSNGGVW